MERVEISQRLERRVEVYDRVDKGDEGVRVDVLRRFHNADSIRGFLRDPTCLDHHPQRLGPMVHIAEARASAGYPVLHRLCGQAGADGRNPHVLLPGRNEPLTSHAQPGLVPHRRRDRSRRSVHHAQHHIALRDRRYGHVALRERLVELPCEARLSERDVVEGWREGDRFSRNRSRRRILESERSLDVPQAPGYGMLAYRYPSHRDAVLSVSCVGKLDRESTGCHVCRRDGHGSVDRRRPFVIG